MPEFEVIDKAVSDRAIATFNDIKSAIEDMGVTVANIPVENYGDKIRSITGEGGVTPPIPPPSEKSEFDLTLTDVTGLSVTLRIYNVTAGNIITVDWGDGTTEDSTTITVGAKTFTHSYETTGQYTATVDSTGEYYPYGSTSTPYNMFNKNPTYICTSARLGKRCERIGNYAFYNCQSLMSIIMPDGITFIGNASLAYLYSLPSITIPESVITIDSSAFINCYSIKKYTMLPETPPTLGNATAISNINGICIIEVPKGSLEAYQSAPNWATYADYMRETEA